MIANYLIIVKCSNQNTLKFECVYQIISFPVAEPTGSAEGGLQLVLRLPQARYCAHKVRFAGEKAWCRAVARLFRREPRTQNLAGILRFGTL